jgi:hypothetical protein
MTAAHATQRRFSSKPFRDEITMAKIWVDIVPTALPDGDESKKALTKPVITKIEKAMTKAIADGLPSNFSEKDSDKPKDKRDDFAARAVRLDEKLRITLESSGSKSKISGNLTLVLQLLTLKKANEPGKLAGQFTRNVAGLERRGAIADVLDKLIEDLLKELDLGGFSKKQLTSSSFESIAKQNNLPLE